jgi:hypothetical protein
MVVGDGYRRYAGHFRAGTTRQYQQHDEASMREVAEALRALPRIFLDPVLPRLPALGAPSGSPARPASGSTWSRTRSSWRGGHLLIFDELYPETGEALRAMPTRFATLAQWYELTWGNVVDTRSALHARCREAGLEVAEETGFSHFHVILAVKAEERQRICSRPASQDG